MTLQCTTNPFFSITVGNKKFFPIQAFQKQEKGLLCVANSLTLLFYSVPALLKYRTKYNPVSGNQYYKAP